MSTLRVQVIRKNVTMDMPALSLDSARIDAATLAAEYPGAVVRITRDKRVIEEMVGKHYRSEEMEWFV